MNIAALSEEELVALVMRNAVEESELSHVLLYLKGRHSEITDSEAICALSKIILDLISASIVGMYSFTPGRTIQSAEEYEDLSKNEIRVVLENEENWKSDRSGNKAYSLFLPDSGS